MEKSCNKSCGPGDWKGGGKCDKNGCMGGFRTILADPPWDQKTGRKLSGKYKKVGSDQLFDSCDNNSQAVPYPTMSVEQVKSLPVRKICDSNAHLYLWVTNQYLPHAFDVIKEWGFEYKAIIIWQKKQIGGGLGGTFRGSDKEFLLFATRGKVNSKDIIRQTIFSVKRPYLNGRPVHSRKPPFFREMIERVSHGPYLELFAREKAAGWQTWGNEVPNDITL